jgi:hypothetical protein
MSTRTEHRERMELAETARAEELLEALDPGVSPADDPAELRRIGFAMRQVRSAEAELRAAVGAARADGRTWAEIGMTLGTTRQAAQARFREPPARE